MANPAAISGTLGTVTGFAVGTAANVFKWTFVTESATHEYATFGDFDRSSIPGKRRHTGTIEFVCEDDIDEIGDIEGSPSAAVSVTLLTSGTKGFTFAAVLDNITLTTDVDGIATGTASFVADGAAAFAVT